MQSYRLRPHVRACVDGANLVFLDLRLDRYRAVSTRSAPRIAGLTTGEHQTDATEASLLSLNLIEAACEAEDPPVQRARAPERNLVFKRDVKPTVRDVACFSSSCAWSAFALRAHRLDQTLASLLRNKALAATRVGRAESVVGVFEELRPWYPRARVCLFDSLALMRFMLKRGVAPTLVMGVRTSPFSAHCWLELNGSLVSDTSDHCASFTPIAWV